MSNNSIVEHRSNYYFVEFREEFLIICLNASYKKQGKSKASPYCKALIMAILEGWTNDKRGKGEDLAIYMTYPQWVDAMYGMFGRCVIIDSLDELIGEGLTSREKYRMYGKDTYKYLLNYRELNQRIKLLPERDPKQKHPKIDASINRRENEGDASKSRRDASINRRVTRLKVDDDPSKSRHNIESTEKPNIEPTESNVVEEIETPILAPVVASSPSLSSSEVTHNVDKLSTEETVTSLEKKKSRKPKVIKEKVAIEDQQRIDAVFDCLDSLARETTDMPDFAYSRSKAASECVKVLLQARTVSPKDLRLVYMEMWNSPKGKDGFSWKENMSVRAICNQYDSKLLAARSKESPVLEHKKVEGPKRLTALEEATLNQQKYSAMPAPKIKPSEMFKQTLKKAALEERKAQ